MGCELRKEIERALRMVVPGRWRLEMHRYGGEYTYTVRRFADADGFAVYTSVVNGQGKTKAEALKNFLDRWMAGFGTSSFPECPASSLEELKLKLAASGV